jgi:hypothetical protein
MPSPTRQPTIIIVRGPGFPPAEAGGTPLTDVPLQVMKKYASSRPLFRPKPRRLPKDKPPTH